MSPHPDPELLSAYIDGELTGTDRDDLEQHLTGCSECSATVRGLRATVADMRALPSPALSEQDQWALRSGIAKARRKPAERYRRWVVGAGSAAAVAAAIVGAVSLTSHNPPKTAAHPGEATAPFLGPAHIAGSPPSIRIDPTNYNSTSARSLLSSASFSTSVPAPRSVQDGTASGAQTNASSAVQATYGSQIDRCEREIFSHGSGGARATAYIVGRYDNTPAFFLIYSVVVGGKTKTEMWVVQQSNCYIRLFLAPQ
jgi:anti-sigma factor RsiW